MRTAAFHKSRNFLTRRSRQLQLHCHFIVRFSDDIQISAHIGCFFFLATSKSCSFTPVAFSTWHLPTIYASETDYEATLYDVGERRAHAVEWLGSHILRMDCRSMNILMASQLGRTKTDLWALVIAVAFQTDMLDTWRTSDMCTKHATLHWGYQV